MLESVIARFLLSSRSTSNYNQAKKIKKQEKSSFGRKIVRFLQDYWESLFGKDYLGSYV